MSNYHGILSFHNLINKEMTNNEITDDLDMGDSSYATTGGDEISYIETSNKSSHGGIDWRI